MIPDFLYEEIMAGLPEPPPRPKRRYTPRAKLPVKYCAISECSGVHLAAGLCDACYWLAVKQRRRVRAEPQFKAKPAPKPIRTLEECIAARRAYASAWRKANRELCQKWVSAWLARNPEKCTEMRNARRSRMHNAEGAFTSADWAAVLETFEHKCPCCGYAGKLTVDHIVPLSRGGTNWPSNIQPLCKSCNSAKGARASTRYLPWDGVQMRFVTDKA